MMRKCVVISLATMHANQSSLLCQLLLSYRVVSASSAVSYVSCGQKMPRLPKDYYISGGRFSDSIRPYLRLER
jgi:hypothetical protein